ncbi:28_t:CDS:1, partial [Dentiscutata heterogama]
FTRMLIFKSIIDDLTTLVSLKLTLSTSNTFSVANFSTCFIVKPQFLNMAPIKNFNF